MSELAVQWVPREPPLRPTAVAAIGEPAVRLVARLRAWSAHRPWQGVAGPGWLVLSGDDPPWVDGVSFLGRDPAAPRLLLPTHSIPMAAGVSVLPLVERRVAALCAGHPVPWALLPGFGVVPMGAARALDEPSLAAWHP